MTVYEDLERTRKNPVVTCSKLSQYLHTGTEENNENS
jgi:hypothetical protein